MYALTTDCAMVQFIQKLFSLSRIKIKYFLDKKSILYMFHCLNKQQKTSIALHKNFMKQFQYGSNQHDEIKKRAKLIAQT